MNFLIFAILGYALVGGSLIINKIQIQTREINPLAYTFYASILQGAAVILIPFGFNLNFSQGALYYSIFSGILFVLALFALFKALKLTELSVVGPFVGALNPLFSLSIGILFFGEIPNPNQLTAFFVLIFGAAILTNLWASKLILKRASLFMLLSGFLFGLSFVFLRETFLQTSFINGLVISRLAAALFAFSFLLVPKLKYQIIRINPKGKVGLGQKLLFLFGQAAAGGANLAIFFAVSKASPALVNSLFGVQYLVILAASIILGKNHPKLLDEKLNKGVIIQKTIGAVILSLGVYLLSR